MITIAEYVGVWANSPDWAALRQANAAALLAKCADLEEEMRADGIEFPDNPKTGSGVSGEVYGGFRPQDCPIGAARSNHKDGLALDRYDPGNLIDSWCVSHQDRLLHHGIYIEHPDVTPRWSHWQSVRPPSGHHVFRP